MLVKLKKILSRITGISTPIGGISWEPPEETSYEKKHEYFIAATVANEAHTDESFQMCMAIEDDAPVSELVKAIKFQRRA